MPITKHQLNQLIRGGLFGPIGDLLLSGVGNELVKTGLNYAKQNPQVVNNVVKALVGKGVRRRTRKRSIGGRRTRKRSIGGRRTTRRRSYRRY